MLQQPVQWHSGSLVEDDEGKRMKKEAGRSKNYRTDKDNRQKKEYPKKEAGEKMISGNNRKNYGDDNHKKRDMNRKNSSGRNKSEDRKSVKESVSGTY